MFLSGLQIMANVPVLRKDHSLVGRDNFPIIKAIRAFKGTLPDTLARLKKDHPLDAYSAEELVTHSEGLLGREVAELLDVAGVIGAEDPKAVPKEVLLMLLHTTILEANSRGQPRWTPLDRRAASPGPSGEGQERGPEAGPKEPPRKVSCV